MSGSLVLQAIAHALEKEKVVWALGGSLMLQQYGLVGSANDIDLLVAMPDAARSHAALALLGRGGPGGSKAPFCTKHFYQYRIEEHDVDVMGDYSTEHEAGVYVLPFDAASVVRVAEVDGVPVPLSALEDWFVLYQLMPAKKGKADLIESYLLEHGVERPDLLERALAGALPDHVRSRVSKLLQAQSHLR
ncbi:MAG TPA: hypothetical protein VFV52_15550 [Bacilli bacterium]|nr:hypothetical protein [Bacilli bacterium]